MKHRQIGKRSAFGGANLFLLTVLLTWSSLIAGTQTTQAEVLPADRRIDWSPGIPGGIPSYPVGANVKDAPYGAKGDGTTDDTAAIQQALNKCPEGKAVLLPAGTYKTTAGLAWRKGVVLRGEGPARTRIRCESGGGSIMEIGDDQSKWESLPVLGGFEAGSNHISMADTSKISVGDLVVLWQENDTAVVGQLPKFHVRAAAQMAVVTGKTQDQVTLSRPLYRTFRKDLKPTLVAYTACFKAGVEDLAVERMVGRGYDNITIRCAAYCWVKNVESYKTRKWHVRLDRCYACEVRDGFFHDGWEHGGDAAYGVGCFRRSTDNLVENNVFARCRHSMIIEFGGCGNVYGYNYSRDPINENEDRTDFLMSDISLHGGGPSMNLFEGNMAAPHRLRPRPGRKPGQHVFPKPRRAAVHSYRALWRLGGGGADGQPLREFPGKCPGPAFSWISAARHVAHWL